MYVKRTCISRIEVSKASPPFLIKYIYTHICICIRIDIHVCFNRNATVYININIHICVNVCMHR